MGMSLKAMDMYNKGVNCDCEHTEEELD